MKKAVVLLSGGLDSATVLALAREQGFACHALSFRYGQRHAVELDAAARVAAALGAVNHRVATVDLGWIGGSALTAAIDVPKDRDVAAMSSEIPVTYVPARNALFLCFVRERSRFRDPCQGASECSCMSTRRRRRRRLSTSTFATPRNFARI